MYYVNALAECGLNRSLLPREWFEPAMDRIQTKFDFSCESFMLLQAMVALGFAETPEIQKLLGQLCPGRLPDGGFLCERRKRKLDYVPNVASAGWKYLDGAKDETGRVILSGTLTKSYLPKEKVGKPSAWATFYAILAETER